MFICVLMISRRRLLRQAALAAMAAPLLAACGRAAAPQAKRIDSPTAGEASAAEPAASAAEGPHWGYQGDEGPQRWAELDPTFATCAGGRAQSPIDLPTNVQPAKLGSIELDYKPTRLSILNNGHTIQVNYDPGSTLTLDGTPYELLQFHFHVPGEHTIGGSHYPMEIHLVHRAADGAVAVVAGLSYGGVRNKPMVMASEARNRMLDLVWQDIPPSGVRIQGKDSINVLDLLPVDRRYVTYEGSLTTPPCTEGVRWIVLTTPTVVTSPQVDKFVSVVGRNARPVQPLNGRRIGGGYIHRPETSAA
jgi:carbonic anhydrase